MVRLFDYNRLSSTKCETPRADLLQAHLATKMQANKQRAPPYSQLQRVPHRDLSAPLASCKSIETAIRKYHQWSSRFLSVPTATHSSARHAESTKTGAMACDQCPSPPSASAVCCLGDSRSGMCHAQCKHQKCDGRLCSERPAQPIRRTRVYESMKEFLRKKLFQSKQNQFTTILPEECNSDMEATSDYDEIDTLDTSYHADEEDDEDICSCNSAEAYDHHMHHRPADRQAVSQCKLNNTPKSMLSLHYCWQNYGKSDTTTEEETETEAVDIAHSALVSPSDDSDAGISDCCQLIGDRSPRQFITRKSNKMHDKNGRKMKQQSEMAELAGTSWFQPRITTKAAFERLQQARPGSFLMRRKSRHYELCVRLESKVKQYAVMGNAHNYHLKGSKKQFTSLRALVTHHSVMSEQLPVTLALPRDQSYAPLMPSRYADDFDTYESLQILGIFKTLQAKNIDFA